MSLTVNQLAFSYRPETSVLRDITFELATGSICCLLGPNGAGKTSLIRCIIGLSKATSGTCCTNGTDVREMPPAALAREIAYVPQSVDTAFALTAMDMVLTGRTPYIRFGATPSSNDRLVAMESMQRVGVDHLAARPFNELSGGERQLVTIARALAQQAPIMVLDEPTSALDFGNQVRVLRIVRDLAQSGIAVLMTSHAPNQALDGADQVILLKDGTLLAAGTPDEVITGPTLSTLYGVQVDVLAFGDDGNRRVCVPQYAAHG